MAEHGAGAGSAGPAKDANAEKSAARAAMEAQRAKIAELEAAQNLPLGVAAGAVAALVGAAIWAGITATTHYQIGYMAVGVGALVGVSLRYFGKGVTPVFGYIGAALALVGCVLGNAMAIAIAVAGDPESGVSFTGALFDVSGMAQVMKATLHPMDFLFYAIAVYEGYQLSFVNLRAAPAGA